MLTKDIGEITLKQVKFWNVSMHLQIALEGYPIQLVLLDILVFYVKAVILIKIIQLLGISNVVHAETKSLIHLKSSDCFCST